MRLIENVPHQAEQVRGKDGAVTLRPEIIDLVTELTEPSFHTVCVQLEHIFLSKRA